MLSSIRVALGHPKESARPNTLKPFVARTPAANGALVDEFCEEVKKAGGNVAQVHSGADVKKYIADLLTLDASVAVSDGSLIKELGLENWLQSEGELLETAIGVTGADYALADTGTLVLVSGGEQHRLISLLPPVHVCLISPENIFPSLTQLLAHVAGKFYSHGRPPQAMTLITGPSRTADIEQTITMGVHGPQSLHVLVVH
jgi:L-lactate dehydrogenase complex protein LldG